MLNDIHVLKREGYPLQVIARINEMLKDASDSSEHAILSEREEF